MVDYLNILNTSDESELLEAKRGSEAGKSISETICAFANTSGGTIVLGIAKEDKTGKYIAEGVSDPDQVSADIATKCRNGQTFNHQPHVEIQQDSIAGKTLLIITVKETSQHYKPIFLQSRGMHKGTFIRLGSSDQRASEEDLAKILQEKNIEHFESSIQPNASMRDISPEALEDYRNVRKEVFPDASELGWSDMDLLEALGCVRKDESADFAPTVGGFFLFGFQQALRRERPTVKVDYIRVSGREWVEDPESRFTSTEIRDYLPQTIRRALSAVMDDLPNSFGLKEGDIQRTDTPVIPRQVLREAIVNAVMHRDYRSDSQIQIIRYSDRIEIHNPGYSLKPTESLKEPRSYPRNPKIASILREMNFAEQKGSGIRAMCQMMQKHGLEEPIFKSDRKSDSFIACFHFHHFLNEESIKWLSRFSEYNLSKSEMRALVYVRDKGRIDNMAYRNMNKVDTSHASTALKRLRSCGLLKANGASFQTWYAPTPNLLKETDQDLSDKFSPFNDNLERLPDNLERLPDNLGRLPDNLGRLPDNLGRLPDNSILPSHLPKALQDELAALGERVDPKKIEEILIELCQYKSWQAGELALILKRNARYLKSRFLLPMVRAGVLAYTLPNQPNHPRQAYGKANRMS